MCLSCKFLLVTIFLLQKSNNTHLSFFPLFLQMLIYLYSDTNYNLNGTDATYVIQNCTNNCSGRGTCDETTHTCDCNTGYMGEGCEWLTCPDNCGVNRGHGTCDQFAMVSMCECNAGHLGEGCEWLTCPDNCGVNRGHGTCDQFAMVSMYEMNVKRGTWVKIASGLRVWITVV